MLLIPVQKSPVCIEKNTTLTKTTNKSLKLFSQYCAKVQSATIFNLNTFPIFDSNEAGNKVLANIYL